jgi:hypothetical protein
MKYFVTIQQQDQVLFQGVAYNMPVKAPILKEFSLRMFGDPEPCLIHQSLVTQRLVDEWVKKLSAPIANVSLSTESYFIDLPLEGAVCSIEQR